MLSIMTKGSQLLSVPNTREGRRFLRDVRTCLNRTEWAIIKVRGRARDRRERGGCREDIAGAKSEWLAVYVDRKRDAQAPCKASAWEDGYRVGHQKAMDQRERVLRHIREQLATLAGAIAAVERVEPEGEPEGMGAGS